MSVGARLSASSDPWGTGVVLGLQQSGQRAGAELGWSRTGLVWEPGLHLPAGGLSQQVLSQWLCWVQALGLAAPHRENL